MKQEEVEKFTPQQAKIYGYIMQVRMKVLVTKCLIWAFFVILAFLILLITVIPSTWTAQTIVGTLDGILGYTMYPLVKHYLPAIQNAKDADIIENE